MSRIDKMIIQGMRSFGPDDSDRGLIQFFTPLTLILGQNGTGKTTIIECLKYITTGEAPPGGRKDGAFIHDPKIAHEREVRGQVRLQFRDVTGQPCVVQRSIQATQKQKNVTTKTLDGLIQRPGPDGKKHSISSKCADLDREMVASLGVSKAVLENVIFCHQEESSWPLSEGKALKAKFDDIFASTRYVKALDCIRKFRQEQTTTIKVYQEEIKYLKQNKEQSTKLQGDLEETQSKLIASKDTVKNVQVKLEPIERDLEKANSRAHDIFKLKTKIEKLKSEKTHLENAVKELEENIQNKFTGSTEKLRRAYNDFQAKVLERQDKLEQLESKMEYKNEEAEKMRSEKSRLLVTQGKLEQEAERHSENITKRDDQIHLLANNYGLEGFAGEIREGSVKEFLGKMKTLVEDRVAEAVAKKEEYDDQVNGIQKKMDEVRELKTQLESKQKMKIDMMVKNKQEIKNINRELSRVDASADRLAGVERELKRAELALKERESSMDTEAVKAELVTLQREKTSLDQKLSELNSEMSRMQLDTEARTQVEMLKKDKVTKEEQIRKIKAKNEDSLKYLLGHMPTENLRRSVEDYASEQGRKVQQCSRRVQQLKMELSSKETNHKMVLEQLRKKEEELRGYEDKIFRVSESQNFDEGLERLQSKMKSAQDNMGALTGTEFLVRKYLNQLDQNDPPCPLCHRPFDTPLEVDELISELRDKLRMVPQKKETCEAELETQKTQYENMLQLKPVRSAMKDLQESDIPELKTKVKKLSEDIGKLRIEITERDEELEALQLDEATAKSMQPDMVTVDRYAAELRELDRKIAREAAKLSSSDTSRTMQQVNSERDEMQLKVETVTRNLDRKRQKLSDHSDKIQQLRANVNDKNAEKLRINADLQERNRLEENKAELESTNETFEREISDAREQLQPLEARVKKLEEEKGEVIKKRDKIWEADREKGNKIKQEGKDVHLMHKEIERYKQEGRDQKLAESKRRMSEINEKLNYAERELEELTSNINKIRKDLDTQQTRERELSDNIQLRKKEEEIKLVGKRIEEEEEQLGGFDPASLDRKRKDLNNQLSELTKERHQAEGRQRALEDEIQRLKRELRTDMFKDAEDKYRDKMIALRTTELANSDLDKYYKALDRAIMTYHSHKMEEINKIIRDLWRTTYKGNDIETIEIRSDEDQGSGAAKTRRTYHYRVVMKKGDTALDMRGRCSAGQRVLASLIIRLALAETFCINCGILALDEPTTNLDRQNIESLAYALVEIIKSRSKQRNFQLVVITHDEEFVELLGKADYVDEFFKVDKDADGKSRIKRARIQDLHLG